MIKLKPRYEFNPNTLDYDKVKPFKRFKKIILVCGSIFLFGLIVGALTNSGDVKDTIINQDHEFTPISKYSIIGSNAWKDSVFKDYERRADLYLNRPEFTGTPLTGEILSLAAWNAFDSTGILLPVELALAQAQWESSMGRKGRSPAKNPFNVGEFDAGTVMWFETTFEGVQAYYYLMCRDYLKCTPLCELFTNFVNCNGKRYASGPYEQHVPKQYYYIKRWIDKELSK